MRRVVGRARCAAELSAAAPSWSHVAARAGGVAGTDGQRRLGEGVEEQEAPGARFGQAEHAGRVDGGAHAVPVCVRLGGGRGILSVGQKVRGAMPRLRVRGLGFLHNLPPSLALMRTLLAPSSCQSFASEGAFRPGGSLKRWCARMRVLDTL
jgi:hypothetical protein